MEIKQNIFRSNMTNHKLFNHAHVWEDLLHEFDKHDQKFIWKDRPNKMKNLKEDGFLIYM